MLALGRAHRGDSLVMNNALTGLDHRYTQLESRIQQVWDEKVGDQFSAVGGAVHDQGIDMKDDARMAMQHRWQTAKAGWMTTLAHEAKPLADAAEAEPVQCVKCAAVLPLPTRRKPVSQPCSACGSVNQVGPPEIVMAYYGWGIQNLADAAALPHRHAVERNRVEVDRWRRARDWAPETVESMERWRDLERAVHETRARTVAQLAGEPVDQKYIDSRMHQFMKFGLDMNQAWIRAHGRST